MPEIKQYYYEKTKEEVSRQHWNTGSCIARNLINKKENKYSHTEGTMANYIRPIIRNNFNEPNGKHQWMKIAEDRLSYLPLSEEEAGYLKQLFDAHNTNNQSAEIMGLYKAGYLTKREAQEKIFNITDYWYGSIMNEFREKFHFTPICIKYLEEVLNFNPESNK